MAALATAAALPLYKPIAHIWPADQQLSIPCNASVDNDHVQKSTVQKELSDIEKDMPKIFTDAAQDFASKIVRDTSTGLRRLKFSRVIIMVFLSTTVLVPAQMVQL